MNMEFAEVVKKYLAAAGQFGRCIPLSSLGLPKRQLEEVFGTLDEDYHISRFLHFACVAADTAIKYEIGGFPQTHVSIDAEVQSIL
jgi:hypothetical protein